MTSIACLMLNTVLAIAFLPLSLPFLILKTLWMLSPGFMGFVAFVVACSVFYRMKVAIESTIDRVNTYLASLPGRALWWISECAYEAIVFMVTWGIHAWVMVAVSAQYGIQHVQHTTAPALWERLSDGIRSLKQKKL